MSNQSLREAAQQARDALKYLITDTPDQEMKRKRAIDTLDAALAQPDEKAQPVAQVVEDLEAIPFRKVAWLGQDLPVGTNLYAAPQPPAEQGAELIEYIASQWDGCLYDDIGGEIDIGDAIRRAAADRAAHGGDK